MMETEKRRISLDLISFQLLLGVLLVLCQTTNGQNLDQYLYLSDAYCIQASQYSACKCRQETDYKLSLDCKSIIISVMEYEEAIFECRDVGIEAFHEGLLPKILINPVTTVKVENCSLRQNVTLTNTLMSVMLIGEIENLSFSSNQLTVHKQQFSELQSVTKLVFAVESLEVFPSDLFEGLPNVEHLTLITNQSMIPNGLFDPMTKLKTLILEGKDHSLRLQDGVFKQLNLESMKITNYKQLIMSNRVFFNYTEFLLTMTRTLLKSLPLLNLLNPSAYTLSFPSLKSIELSANVEEIPEYLFSVSRNIKFINLHGNKIRNLRFNLFKDQYFLEYLDVSNNLLTALPNNIFNSTKLKRLILSHNQLTEIPRFPKTLEKLWLDNNNLSFINEFGFQKTKNIRYLNLTRNCLDNDSLRKLLYNNYTHDEPSIIDLSHNNITNITHDDLKRIFSQNLHLYLTNNRIETLDFSYIDSNVESRALIDISDNPISCDCKLTHFVNYLKNQKKLNVETKNLVCKEPKQFKGVKLIDIDVCSLRCPIIQSESCPEPCRCEHRSCDNVFIMNCSNSRLSYFPTLPMVDRIHLDLQNNNLKNLPLNRSEIYDKVFSLNLAGNNLTNIDASQLPAYLETLDLRGNNLTTLPDGLFKAWSSNSSTLKEIYLSQNPWPCNCDSQILLEFSLRNSKVVDKDVLQCLDASNQFHDLMKFTVNELCPDSKDLIIGIASAVAVFGLMMAALMGLYYRYKIEVKVWLYSHNMCLWFVSVEDLEKDQEYDGFVSYSHKDKDFVQKELLPFLEHGPHPFKICDHERDWLVGATIPEQIIKSVENSRRTLIVLSDNYLDSVWGRMEFQAAHQLAMEERQGTVIVILYGEIKNTEKVDSELKAYLSMNTYLEWGNPWFWKKLLYAMPHSKYSKAIREFSKHDEAAVTTDA